MSDIVPVLTAGLAGAVVGVLATPVWAVVLMILGDVDSASSTQDVRHGADIDERASADIDDHSPVDLLERRRDDMLSGGMLLGPPITLGLAAALVANALLGGAWLLFTAMCVIAALTAIVLVIALSYWYRADVQITAVRIEDGKLVVAIENRGRNEYHTEIAFVTADNPTRPVGIVDGRLYLPRVAAESQRNLLYRREKLAPACPPGSVVSLVLLDGPRASRPYGLSDLVLAWIRAT